MISLPIQYITGEEFDGNPNSRGDKIYIVKREDVYDIWFRNTFLTSSARQSANIEDIYIDGKNIYVKYDNATLDELPIPDRVPIPTFKDNILTFGETLSVDLSYLTTPVAKDASELECVPTVGLVIQIINDYLIKPLELSSQSDIEITVNETLDELPNCVSEELKGGM